MFKIRQSAPTAWNKLYNNYNNGGLSWCINGQPTNPISNVLSNCVGWACSRFNEIYNSLSGYDGMKYPQLCCNAEDFWEVAATLGLQRGQTPKPGAIMCWEGIGSLAGHVAIVEKVVNQTQVYTSESGWQSAYFWNSTRYFGDGNWGCNGNYRFRGFIYNPAVKDEPTPKPKKKSITTIAKEVIAGKWGNYPERKKKLEKAGYDYAKVQAKVDEILKAQKEKEKAKKKSVTTIAKEVIAGKWGNYPERKTRLEKAGYDYAKVQKKVNELMAKK